jgi:hypothetical protein
MAVKLSVLCAGRALPSKKIPGTHFLESSSGPLEGLGKFQQTIKSHLIGCQIIAPNIHPALLDYSFFFFSFMGWGWDWVHLVRRPLIDLLYQSRMVDEYGALDKYEVLGENIPSATSPVKNPPCFVLGSKPSRCGGKPATNRLNYARLYYWISKSKSYPRNRPLRLIGLWDVKDITLSRQSAHS